MLGKTNFNGFKIQKGSFFFVFNMVFSTPEMTDGISESADGISESAVGGLARFGNQICRPVSIFRRLISKSFLVHPFFFRNRGIR